MATFRKLSSNKIQAIVRIKGYPQRSKSFASKVAAKLWATRLEDSLRTGELDNTGLTVPQIIDMYMERNKQRECFRRDKYIADKQCTLWRGIKADDFSLLHLNEYKRHRLSKVSTGTARKDCGFIRRAWNSARLNGYTLPHLFSTFQLPRDGAARERIPTRHELDMILGNCSELLAAIIEFASLTAMRRGEILSIDTSCVNTDRNIVYLSKTKNGDSRHVPLCKRSMELLAQWDYSFNAMPDSVTQGFSRACKRVGIEGLCFHSLRHFAITQMCTTELTVIQIAKVVGHKDLNMTLRYSHPDIETISEIIRRE